MELRVDDIQLPDVIQFNYDELKRELTEKVQKYETLVYTEDQIKEAKADKASLNKLKKALNDERIKREREYMQPFNEFKTKINEIIAIIDKPVAIIDKQVKEFDEKRKADKRIEIGSFWETTEHPDWLTLAKLFDERWLNAGYSMRQIKDDINGWNNRIKTELDTLAKLPEFSYEATEEYKRTLDINLAIAEGQRLAEIQKRKAETEAKIKAQQEAEKAGEQLADGYEAGVENVQMENYMTPPVNPATEGQWIRFAALLTIQQAKELKKFFDDRKIEFKAI